MMLTSENKRTNDKNSHMVNSKRSGHQMNSPVHFENQVPDNYISLGNQARQRFAQSCPMNLPTPSSCPFGGICHSCTRPIQAKLKISQPDDEYEREADRIADKVMRMEEPSSISLSQGLIQRKFIVCETGGVLCPKCAKKETSIHHKQSVGSTSKVGLSLHTQISGLCGDGQPLEPSVRAFFELRFGRDFSQVRVHTGSRAANIAKDARAKAFTFGKDIVFGKNEYTPENRDGQRLLAHELTHVVQQNQLTASPILQRFPNDVTQMSITNSYAAGLSDEQLLSDLNQIRNHLGTLSSGSPEYEVAFSNLDILQMEARTRNLVTSSESIESLLLAGGPSLTTVPVNVTFSMNEEDAREFGREAAIGRSIAIGGAKSLGYIVSPPIRGFVDPFLPLGTRMGGGGGPLGELGGTYAAERYVSSQFMRDLRPRIYTEASKLALEEITGGSKWLVQYRLKGRDLERLPGLVARMSEGGTLKPAELRIVQKFFRAHGEHGLTFASPAMSGTIQPGLSRVSNVAEFLTKRPYVVRIEVPSSAVGEVNAVLGTNRRAQLVQELEVLIFTDGRGNVTNIQPNPASSLGRAAPYLRWGGRALLVVSVAVSTYRISTATPKERPRVIGEEAGGGVGALVGSALVTAGCIALGIATEGIVLFICGLAGGIGGGIGGSVLGGETGEAIGPNPIERAGSWAVDAYTESMMESPDPVVRQDAIAIRRFVYQDDTFSLIYLMNRFCGDL